MLHNKQSVGKCLYKTSEFEIPNLEINLFERLETEWFVYKVLNTHCYYF